MANLTNDMQVYIIRCLASYMTPTETAEAVKEEFEDEIKETGIKITRQQVARYDPYKAAGKDLKKEFVDLFNESRENFKNDLEAIPLANKAYRIATLQSMMFAAIKSGNRPLAASFIEQAAKEMGSYYTNTRKLDIESPKGTMTPQQFDLSELSDEDIRQLIKIADKSEGS